MGRDSIGTEPDGSEEESAGGFGVPGTGLKMIQEHKCCPGRSKAFFLNTVLFP